MVRSSLHWEPMKTFLLDVHSFPCEPMEAFLMDDRSNQCQQEGRMTKTTFDLTTQNPMDVSRAKVFPLMEMTKRKMRKRRHG